MLSASVLVIFVRECDQATGLSELDVDKWNNCPGLSEPGVKRRKNFLSVLLLVRLRHWGRCLLHMIKLAKLVD